MKPIAHMPRDTSRRLFLALWATAAGAAGAMGLGNHAAAADATGHASLYRSGAGRAAVMTLYERKLQRLSIAHESQMVETRFGQTHVLTIGPSSGPPLVVLHGVHFGAPFMADFAGPLAEKFRIYIPDIVGQPGRSAELQPAPSGHNYANWLTDVLDGLKLDVVPLVGISFGGAIALDLAASAPERISKATLIVPGGFAGSLLTSVAVLFRLFLPWQAYRIFPSRARLTNVLHPLAWEMDEDYYTFFDAILRHVHWLIPPPGPFSREDLQAFRAPTAIYAARQDIFFPGDDLVREARIVIPNLVDAAVFDSSHFPTNAMTAEVMRRATAFLA